MNETILMKGALLDAAKVFRYYEKLHRDKGTIDGEHKAQRNRQLADRCTKAANLQIPEGVECIVAAAVIRHTGDAVSISPPARHADIIKFLADAGDPTPINGEQGFLTSTDRFVDRKEAWKIATEAEQIIDPCGTRGILFSENVW